MTRWSGAKRDNTWSWKCWQTADKLVRRLHQSNPENIWVWRTSQQYMKGGFAMVGETADKLVRRLLQPERNPDNMLFAST